MCPAVTKVVFKMQKPAMSLKQFMLRSEILKLYRGYLRLGKLLDEPPSESNNTELAPPTLSNSSGSSSTTPSTTNSSTQSKCDTYSSRTNPMKTEWTEWVRSEFRLRQASSADEEITRALLVHGKRQLQEMERTIMLATNRNTPVSKSKSSCKNKDKLSDNASKTKTVE